MQKELSQSIWNFNNNPFIYKFQSLYPYENIAELILCKSDGFKGYLSFYRHVKHTHNVTQNPEQMDV